MESLNKTNKKELTKSDKLDLELAHVVFKIFII